MSDKQFTPKQIRSIALADARADRQEINLWHGAIRSGKTVGSLVKYMMKIAEAGPTGEIVLIGRTRETLYRNILAPMMDGTIYGVYAAHVIYNRGAPTAQIFGRTVHVIGASDARAESVIRGLTISVAYIDEVSLVAEEFFNQLMGRCSVEGAWVGCTTNPDGPQHWLKQNWIDRAEWVRADGTPGRHRIFHFTLHDNAHNLPEGLIEGYYRQYTGLWRKRMIDGEWSLAAGAIYPMFDPEQHVVSELPPIQRLISCGVDYGVTNATRGELLGIGEDNCLYVIGEWAPGDGSEAERADSLNRFYMKHGFPEATYIDPAAAGFRREVRLAGFTQQRKASNAVLDGIGVVASLLSAGRLKIHESATELIKELPGYVWDETKTEKGEDSPIKVNDHACFVAGTQVETAEGPQAIETIKAGDKVWTREGLRPVVESDYTGTHPTFDVELSDGKVLTGTGNHPVWVCGEGWKRLDSLRYGDKLESWETRARQSFSTESSSADTPKLADGPSAHTSHQGSLISSEASGGCTKNCGCTPTALVASRLGIISTTSTTTQAITTPATCKRSPHRIMPPTTASNPDQNANAIIGTANVCQRPQSGTARHKGSSGTASTAQPLGKVASTGESRASSAVAPTRPGKCNVPTGSVPTPANRHARTPPSK